MQYLYSSFWTRKAREVARVLGYTHIDPSRVSVVLSKGSRARRTVARIHGLGKALQAGMRVPPHYVIELVSERFDRQSEREKLDTLVHELNHIPACFGGGFRNHATHVTRARVRREVARYLALAGGGKEPAR